MRILGAFVAGLTVAALVAIAILYFADLEVVESPTASDSDRVGVSNVLGQQTDDAEAEIRAADLDVEVSRPWAEPADESMFGDLGSDPTDTVETVRTQNPDPGADVEPDATVTISVR